MTLPNLIGCGAGKSGTTSLYYYLSQHPEISMAPSKEVHYFTMHFDKGADWYAEQFAQCKPAPILGELSTSYLRHPAVPGRIQQLVPDVKLFFIFRNPMDRVYSNYWFSISIGTQDPAQSFSEVIHSPQGLEQYIDVSKYSVHLKRYIETFAADNIYVLFTEELKRQPLVEMSAMYRWLGVDATFEPDVTKKYNVTFRPTNKLQSRVWDSWLAFKKAVKPAFMWISPKVRKQFADAERDISQKVMTTERPPISAEDKTFLEQVFQEEKQALSKLLNREIPW